MKDTKAEAVLVALADPLVWRRKFYRECKAEDAEQETLASAMKAIRPGPRTDFTIKWWKENEDTIEFSLVENGYYGIRVRQKYGLFRIYTACFLFNSPHELGQSPKKFRHHAYARAACERHHATGKWE